VGFGTLFAPQWVARREGKECLGWQLTPLLNLKRRMANASRSLGKAFFSFSPAFGTHGAQKRAKAHAPQSISRQAGASCTGARSPTCTPCRRVTTPARRRLARGRPAGSPLRAGRDAAPATRTVPPPRVGQALDSFGFRDFLRRPTSARGAGTAAAASPSRMNWSHLRAWGRHGGPAPTGLWTPPSPQPGVPHRWHRLSSLCMPAIPTTSGPTPNAHQPRFKQRRAKAPLSMAGGSESMQQPTSRRLRRSPITRSQ